MLFWNCRRGMTSPCAVLFLRFQLLQSSVQSCPDQRRGEVSGSLTRSQTSATSSPSLPRGTYVHSSPGANQRTPRLSSMNEYTAKQAGVGYRPTKYTLPSRTRIAYVSGLRSAPGRSDSCAGSHRPMYSPVPWTGLPSVAMGSVTPQMPRIVSWRSAAAAVTRLSAPCGMTIVAAGAPPVASVIGVQKPVCVRSNAASDTVVTRIMLRSLSGVCGPHRPDGRRLSRSHSAGQMGSSMLWATLSSLPGGHGQ